jgi:hypothetical protein
VRERERVLGAYREDSKTSSGGITFAVGTKFAGYKSGNDEDCCDEMAESCA